MSGCCRRRPTLTASGTRTCLRWPPLARSHCSASSGSRPLISISICVKQVKPSVWTQLRCLSLCRVASICSSVIATGADYCVDSSSAWSRTSRAAASPEAGTSTTRAPAVTLTYDTKGNVTGGTDSLGNSIQLTYDTNNNLTHIVDPKGNNYDLQYTGLDLTKIIDPKTGEINLTYNSYGQLLTLQDPKGNSTTYAYDTSGNLTTVTNPLTGQGSYTYDTIGWVATHTDPKNNTTSVVRDGLGRVTQVTYQDQSIKTFVYDCCSLGSVTDSNGMITFAYDTLKRLSSVTDIYGKVVSFGYDKNSNLTALTYPDGKIVNYDYDDANRLTKVTDWLNNLVTYNYDLVGDLIKTNYPDGSTINNQFDNGGRLTGITDFKSDASLNAFYKYTLDQLGNRTGISFSQPLNVKPTPPDTSYTHDIDNRLLTAGSLSFGYDDNGNLITKTLGSNVTNYSWDFNDMLTQVTKDGNTYVYRYDALGNRVAKVVNSVETRYIGGLAETDAAAISPLTMSTD